MRTTPATPVPVWKAAAGGRRSQESSLQQGPASRNRSIQGMSVSPSRLHPPQSSAAPSWEEDAVVRVAPHREQGHGVDGLLGSNILKLTLALPGQGCVLT